MEEVSVQRSKFNCSISENALTRLIGDKQVDVRGWERTVCAEFHTRFQIAVASPANGKPGPTSLGEESRFQLDERLAPIKLARLLVRKPRRQFLRLVRTQRPCWKRRD